MKQGRCLTIVEGREANRHMVDQISVAAKKIGWTTRLIKTISVDNIAENRFKDLFTDYVLWRSLYGGDLCLYGSERIFAYLNASDRVTINTRPVGGVGCTSNKFFQHGAFAVDPELENHVLPMYRASSREKVLDLVKQGKLKYPFVLKPEHGTKGEGILLIKEEKDIPEKLVDMATEPYIQSTYNWRVFVLDGKPLNGALRKVGDAANEANFAAKSGGRQRCGETDQGVLGELYRLAVKAARTLGLDYTGVDLIRDDTTGKYYVLEANFAGGWQNGFYEATGVYVPDEIMKFFERKYQERVSR